MIKIKDIVTYAILMILAALVYTSYLTSCNRQKQSSELEDTLSIKHDTVYVNRRDTIYKNKLVPVKVLTLKEYYKTDTIVKNIDTNRVVNDYYSFNLYKDTTSLGDSLGYVVVDDTIHMNKLHGRSILTNYNIPYITKTVKIHKINKDQVYLGAYSGVFSGRLNVGLDFTYTHKEKQNYRLGIGVDTKGDPSVNFGVGYRIYRK